MNFKWPATPENSYAPWYDIARRIIAMPVILVGLGLIWIAHVVGFGLKTANKVAEQIWWDVI